MILDDAYMKLPGSLVLVGVTVGFHDEGKRLAHSLRARFLARLLTRLSEGGEPTDATLRDDAAELLLAEERAGDIFLTACILTQRPEGVRALAAGNYDVWQVRASGISHVLAGSSVWNAAAAAGATADGLHKNICVSALSSDRSKSVVYTVDLAVEPADVIVVTRGDIDPELFVRYGRKGGRGEVVVAFDDGQELDVGGFGRYPRADAPRAFAQR